ncbi:MULTISPECIES: hypothetical protein [Pseudomonas syringae group]|uniref:hypothetical protein n=1 Tax=Pseudomonas syringae group TaxID=136849 RepID=UPI000A81DA72|nr:MULTISPECIES: hypothetical protein [Pseudomonas syringae group]RMS75438.1 Filamentous hemagglutinin protein [Pseudomonas savastanoi]RMT55909.1 Filamentous hemagglutinin protein [Pseudomonas savastanoi]
MIAGNNLVNAGLIEAGNRLDLLAGNDLINTAGGIIKGHDVSLTAINDDVINKGCVLESGRDMTIQASRDVTIVPTEVTNSLSSG